MRKLYLDVAYQDRELAKRLGARWDGSLKRWYCEQGSPLATIYSWRRSAKPADKPVAKPAGAGPKSLTENPSPALRTAAQTPVTDRVRSDMSSLPLFA